MPEYQWRCPDCGSVKVKVLSMKEILHEEPPTCERCGGIMKQVIHSSGISWKCGGSTR